MATVQELVAKFKADTSDFNRKMHGVQKDVRETSNQIKILGTALAGAAVAVGVFSVKVGAAMQQSQKRIEAMLGSAKQAQSVIDSLRQAGFETGASVQQLANSYGKLATFVDNGTLSLKESLDISKGLSATSLALGASTEQLNQVMFGLSQAMGSGTVRAEEFNQVTEPLPGIINRMEEAAGLATGELRKMINSGEVSSEMFKDFLIPALKSFTKEADQMVGTLQAQSGILTNTLQAIGEDIYDYLEAPLVSATRALDEFLQGFVSVGRASADELQRRLNENIAQQSELIQNMGGQGKGAQSRKRLFEKLEAENDEIIAQLEKINSLADEIKTGKKTPTTRPSRAKGKASTGRKGRTTSRKAAGSVSTGSERTAETFSILEVEMADEIVNEIDVIEQAMDQLSTSVISSFFEMSQTGKFSFQDMARSIINDLQAIMVKTLAMKAITGLAGSVMGMGTSSLAGASITAGSTDPAMSLMNLDAIGAARFDGARASGGSVLAGRSYLVGEKGPEILTMGGNSGYISSNQQSFGGGGQVINIDARGSQKGVEQDIRRVMGELKTLKGQVPNMAIAAVRDQNSRTVGFLR